MSIRKLDEKHREFLHFHQKYVWQDRDRMDRSDKMCGGMGLVIFRFCSD